MRHLIQFWLNAYCHNFRSYFLPDLVASPRRTPKNCYTGKSRDYDMASPDLRHQCHGNRPRERPEWALRYFEQSPKCMGIFLFSMALSTCKFCLKARIILDPLLRLEPRHYGSYRDSPISPSRCHAASF